jgi:hypothetical protein
MSSAYASESYVHNICNTVCHSQFAASNIYLNISLGSLKFCISRVHVISISILKLYLILELTG